LIMTKPLEPLVSWHYMYRKPSQKVRPFSSIFIIMSVFLPAASATALNVLFQLHMQLSFQSYLWLTVCIGPINPSSVPCPCLEESSHSRISEHLTPSKFEPLRNVYHVTSGFPLQSISLFHFALCCLAS
jgi:hypothetical protein